MSPILLSPLIEKNTKILHGDNFLVTSRSFTKPAETSLKNVLDCSPLPLYQNHMHTVLPFYLSGAVSQSHLRCYLLGCSPHISPNKTTLIPCIFKVDTH